MELAGDFVLRYPEDLPITARRAEIAELIRQHQVVVVAGETGSGKSTQLPKICLDIGRGRTGMIAHTQPRRVAARAIAARVAQELGVEVGGAVAYSVRFDDRVAADTRVRVLTDGLLLAELRTDRLLTRYDTIIIDEAHERSLTIDFLLGYLRRILPERPDLRVIITSATIDTARFAAHFAREGVPAPVVEVTGRSYPVEIRYAPPADDVDQVDAVVAAVDEMLHTAGDVLVFVSGEREIHDAADALRTRYGTEVEVLPLYARLSTVEQQRVFAPHERPRVVLSTNVAETSITVPGIRAVVDTGLARISRYSRRLKVQRLPIEPIARAAADQRAGRCGRVAPGICVRLYSQEDYAARPEFGDPEILRTNLAAVMLQMASLRLGPVEEFAFLDPPDRAAVRDGRLLLEELGAIEMEAGDAPGTMSQGVRLTALGERLARLPVDPRLGRMVIAAAERGVVREVLVIAAALSIRDPRERPEELREQAVALHRRFQVAGSDLMGWVALWDYLRAAQRTSSASAFRRLCRAEFINYVRVREWQDLYSQLRRAAAAVGIWVHEEVSAHGGAEHVTGVGTASGTNTGTQPGMVAIDGDLMDRVHYAVLAGHLSHLGQHDPQGRDYRGARGSRFVIAPPSVLARRETAWVVAAELVETDRLRARAAARVSPAWAEELGAHLLTRRYGEPVWEARRGAAMAPETVSLFGLVLAADRRVPLWRVDPEGAREMFIRHALVERDWPTRHKVLAENDRTLAEMDDVQQRSRRVAPWDAEDLMAFYMARIPESVVSGRHFDRWWSRRGRRDPDLLRIAAHRGERDDREAYPDSLGVGTRAVPYVYRHEPGSPLDGVSLHIPITLLNQVSGRGQDWLVPGYREELVAALVRSLPTRVRRDRGALAEMIAQAQQAAAREPAHPDGSVVEWLAAHLGIEPGEIALDRLPAHLRMKYVVLGTQGQVLDAGSDLTALRARQTEAMCVALVEATGFTEVAGLTEWTVGTVASEVLGPDGEIAYPALIDEVHSVRLSLTATPRAQRAAHHRGLRRLLLATVAPSRRKLLAALTPTDHLALAGSGVEAVDLARDAAIAAVDRILEDHLAAHGMVWDAEAFAALSAAVRSQGPSLAADLLGVGVAVVATAAGVRARVATMTAPSLEVTVADVGAHLERLVPEGFLVRVGARRMPDVARYVRGVEMRLDGLAGKVDRDVRRVAELAPLEARYRAVLAARGPRPEVVRLGWELEELRLGVFVPSAASGGLSAARVERALRALEG